MGSVSERDEYTREESEKISLKENQKKELASKIEEIHSIKLGERNRDLLKEEGITGLLKEAEGYQGQIDQLDKEISHHKENLKKFGVNPEDTTPGTKKGSNLKEKYGHIENSESFFETMGNLYDAVTKSGKFKDVDDNLLGRISAAFAKGDTTTKMLAGAGIMAAVSKILDIEEDDDSDEQELDNDENSASSNLTGELKKNKQESETLVARITNSMQQQNVTDNLTGGGMAIKSLAMISLKTQDGLISISEYLHRSTLATNRYLKSLSEAIDDIEEDSSSAFESLFPLLIGGIVTAFATSFLEGDGKEGGILDRIVKSVTDSVFNRFREALGVNNDGDLLDIIFQKAVDAITKSNLIKNVTTLVDDINNSGLITQISDLINTLNTKDSTGEKTKLESIISSLESAATSIENIDNKISSLLSALGVNPQSNENKGNSSSNNPIESIISKLDEIVKKLKEGGNFAEFIDKIANPEKLTKELGDIILDGAEGIKDPDGIFETKIAKGIRSVLVDFGAKLKGVESGAYDKLKNFNGNKKDIDEKINVSKQLDTEIRRDINAKKYIKSNYPSGSGYTEEYKYDAKYSNILVNNSSVDLSNIVGSSKELSKIFGNDYSKNKSFYENLKNGAISQEEMMGFFAMSDDSMKRALGILATNILKANIVLSEDVKTTLNTVLNTLNKNSTESAGDTRT